MHFFFGAFCSVWILHKMFSNEKYEFTGFEQHEGVFSFVISGTILQCFMNIYVIHAASLLISADLFTDLNLYSVTCFQVLQKPLITRSLKSDKVYLDFITVGEEVNLNNTNNQLQCRRHQSHTSICQSDALFKTLFCY